MVCGQIGGDIIRSIARRRRGDDRKDDARVFSERPRGCDEARGGVRGACANAVVSDALRCLDVEGDERRRTSSAKTARQMEACFAETRVLWVSAWRG
jgi:hypothetical protein